MKFKTLITTALCIATLTGCTAENTDSISAQTTAETTVQTTSSAAQAATTASTTKATTKATTTAATTRATTTTAAVTEPPVIIEQYTHTFVAPEGWLIIPDYSDAIDDIRNKTQPTSFAVECKWICPACGTENLPFEYDVAYDEDDEIYLPEQNCRLSSCHYDDKHIRGWLNSYAIQTS